MKSCPMSFEMSFFVYWIEPVVARLDGMCFVFLMRSSTRSSNTSSFADCDIANEIASFSATTLEFSVISSFATRLVSP